MEEFRMRPNEEIETDTLGETTYYDEHGEETSAKDDSVAKVYSRGGKNSYSIKVKTTGMHSGGFYNPLEHNPSDLSSSAIVNGRQRFEFRKVTEEQFKGYMRFLATGNKNYLLIAERIN